ncbi:histidinol-phosphatase [Stackebrandtia albiflava]|uniref:Histidinol-phosphatase n=1 Tax=Stackebrandtia albiflava TaxID=406432 RepID=A0A562V578_9ACTN|nr:histidinol-phosphatase [Stackebrandtia albiflava]TWJ13015.1 histidinol-phosphatase [Stackebrandtia albiflava]
MPYSDDLGLAHLLADSADSVTTDRFRSLDLKIDTKPDMTPVSDADTATEKALRSTLARARPRDGVMGEEFGDEPGAGSRRWVIDPIDGTKNFIRGVPVWATLIALFDGTEPVVGVVSAPALGRRWWAAKGAGAFAGRHRTRAERIEVSGVRRVPNCSISYSSLPSWFDHGRGPQMVELLRRSWRSRAYGDFYSYMLVAEGAVDAALEPEVALWDLAAPSVIVTEAGGRFTDLGGRPGPDGGSAVASNGVLHDEVLTALEA